MGTLRWRCVPGQRVSLLSCDRCRCGRRRWSMVIACQDFGDTQRTDAATVPPFDNDSVRAACDNRRGIRVHYSPGSRDIAGPHFGDCASARRGGMSVPQLLPQHSRFDSYGHAPALPRSSVSSASRCSSLRRRTAADALVDMHRRMHVKHRSGCRTFRHPVKEPVLSRLSR
jgi:hypothetical protein